ncbi:MAG: type II toxin-antitoxin system VapC family toxin [Blastocatellia bacterium]|nr:type II toxin-antitoxin system VapC family toxin [Blastocatellia bacterium]
MTPTKYLYLDASALAKRYTLETGTPIINYLFEGSGSTRFVVLSVGIAEVAAILVRKRNAKVIPVALYSQAIVNFSAEILSQPELRVIPATAAMATDSIVLIGRHSINATDAILLCSALELAESFRSRADDLILVASDLRLLRAAEAEGLAVFNPETQTAEDLDRLLS